MQVLKLPSIEQHSQKANKPKEAYTREELDAMSKLQGPRNIQLSKLPKRHKGLRCKEDGRCL